MIISHGFHRLAQIMNRSVKIPACRQADVQSVSNERVLNRSFHDYFSRISQISTD